MPSLGATYGRGAATLAQWDLANSDFVLVMGSNMAENHPIAFRFVMQAKEKGATVINADPRFTRTSAMCDIYAPIRPGTDIAFLGGLINYVLENERYFEEYVKVYTNAATIITEDFEDAGASGLFSGWDGENRQYDPSSWRYEGMPIDYASVGGSQGRIVGEAGPGPSYLDPGSGGPENDFTNRNTTFMTWNLMHLAKMLQDAGGVPGYGNQRTAWDDGTRFDWENPEYR